MSDLRRAIQSVERVLSSDPFAVLLRDWPRELVTTALRAELAAMRSELAQGHGVTRLDEAQLAARVGAALAELATGSLMRVINATGVVLHTNLGRAPLAGAALDAMLAVAGGYSNLEMDLATGARGSRYEHCRALLCHLTGAADALVVNNNAAALVLALNTVARGRDVIVSRGELVEIGGAFRVPDIMTRSGARLREVGATNRTTVSDYRDAIDEHVGALLKVHPSNFTIAGYTASAEVRELSTLGGAAGLPLIHDIGSGLLLEPGELGLPADEPTPRVSLTDGAAIVTMSGDKLLGGPQCGILLGTAELVGRMRRNPLCRALRVDKLTIAGLTATLRLHLDPDGACRDIPVLRMLTLPAETIAARAQDLAAACRSMNWDVEIIDGWSAVGGGAAAAAELPTRLVLLGRPGTGAHELERRLRASSPPVVARIVEDRLALDVRTVQPAETNDLLRVLGAAAAV